MSYKYGITNIVLTMPDYQTCTRSARYIEDTISKSKKFKEIETICLEMDTQ